MLLIPVVEQFDAAMLKLPGILKELDGPARRWGPACDIWLGEVTALAEQYHLYPAADLALLRSRLALFEPEPGCRDRAARRNAAAQCALDCLTQARACLEAYFSPFRASTARCEALCTEAVAVVQANGLFPAAPTVDELWQALHTDAQLLEALTRLVGAVGAPNARVLLDRAIPQVYTQGGIPK